MDTNPSRKDEMTLALRSSTEAALHRLDELAQEDKANLPAVKLMRSYYQRRESVMTEREKMFAEEDAEKTHQIQGMRTTFQHLRQEVRQAERQAVIQLRNKGKIDDEIFHSIERDLDLEETRLEGR